MGAELRVDTISEKTSSNGVVIDLVTLKDGVVSASGINLGNAALVESELEMLDGITAGTVIASKALVADANIDITGGRNITISGELDAATLDISGNADIDGTLEADAITVNGVTLAETISDTVGSMVTSNTESGITVAYDDADNTLDFTVGTLNQNTTGTAATVTGAAQSNITSLGTLTTLTVDNIITNGSNIGHTSDTDLITLADGIVTVAGELDAVTGDFSGAVDIAGATTLVATTISGPTIATRPSVVNLADDGSIPITATSANIDANGTDRTGIKFAGAGTAGQILVVNNTGGEKLTFHNTEGTALLRGINADHDTMEANFVGLFISDGNLWNLIAGGADTQPDVGLTAS
jgi:hypothetical protein